MQFAIERSDLALDLGVAGAVATLAWVAVVAVIMLATRTKDPVPESAGLEFGGDEPPAVVNLVTRGWKVRGEAVSATLVDLAARHVLEFVPQHDGTIAVALGHANSTLTDYERQVLDVVRDLADGDTPVPAAALTLGTESLEQSFNKRFAKAVIADARRRGLSRPRWTKTITVLVGVVAVAPALLVAGAVVALPDAHTTSSSSSSDDPIGAFIGVAILVWGLYMAAFRWLRAERDTPAGLTVAGRWLGLRDNLDSTGTFADLPPTAVAVWDRYLAYGVALGVAATAERTFPLGAESATEAWSPVGGRWRLVRIRYPRRIPPGWGRPPWKVTAVGLLSTGVAGAAAVYLMPALYDLQGQVLEDAAPDDRRIALGVGVGLAVLVVLIAVVALRGLWMLVLGVADLGRTHVVDGRVLRVRTKNERTYVAIDAGAGDHLRAWVAPMGAAQGVDVRAMVATHVGYVRHLDVPPIVVVTSTGSAQLGEG